MKITSIKFPAFWDRGRAKSIDLVHFQLGLGPCGKVVTRLDTEIAQGLLTIRQVHEDGSRKSFIYQLSQITGRIETDLVSPGLTGPQ